MGGDVDDAKANGDEVTVGALNPATWAQGHWERDGAKVTVQDDIVLSFFNPNKVYVFSDILIELL